MAKKIVFTTFALVTVAIVAFIMSAPDAKCAS